MDNQENYIPVSFQEACDDLGLEVDEVKDDAILKRKIDRLIKFSDKYLQGAVGKNYPKDDERAKEIALLVINDLYESRHVEAKNISNTTRKLLNDLEWQLKLELMSNGD